MERLQLDDLVLEYVVKGSGTPVLLINPSLVADALTAALLGQQGLTSSYQLIGYRRRGYGGSSSAKSAVKPLPNVARRVAAVVFRHPRVVHSLERVARVLARPRVSMANQAADAAALLDHLDVSRAHVVGHSIGGVIALQLAHDRPDLVHTLALLEPALQMVPSGRVHQEQAVFPALESYFSGDKSDAVDRFLTVVFGSEWQSAVEAAVPGGVSQAVADADTFFGIEGPAMVAWKFGPVEAAGLTMPVLSVLGTASVPFFHDGRRLLHDWFGQLEDLDLQGANHLLQVQDPTGMALGLKTFFADHPMADTT